MFMKLKDKIMTGLIDVFTAMCEDKGIHGLALVGNESEYAVQTVGEYDAIGESLYFALSEDAKFVLHDLAKEMQKHPEVKLRIVGHTSLEGDPAFNQKLSQARAQAAVDFLVSRGIDANRLEAEGKGSSEIIDENNPEANRRTEFIILE